MNKADLVEALEERLGGKKAAADALEAIFDVIIREVARGGRVGITGFGTFERVDRAARTGRNPRTGDSVRIESTALPRDCLLVFGQEGPGITEEARAGAASVVSIAQFGSTRSINASVAAGIAMHAWIVQWGDLSRAW